ncbi:MAG: GNAT family N-acetyltransferase [Thermomicrobiales bacterium]|nr:GNAT family N-acetyltransferase [Thermomicrobiales bacterium]
MSAPAEPIRDRAPGKQPVDQEMPRPRPQHIVHEGRWARLEPLDPTAHAADLYALGHADEAARRTWDYLPYGPFPSAEAHAAWLTAQATADDPLFFAVVDRASGQAVGVASLMSIAPEHGSIEIGHLWFSPRLQRTPVATEALYLLLTHALDDLGYRRMEWKCDAANAASRRAAARLGYRHEGVFFNHRVVKGHNRDTAWFSILDEEWPRLRAAFAEWLAPENFNADGTQRARLSDLTRPSAP